MPVNVARLCSFGLGFLLMVVSTAANSYAGDFAQAVPEIDPAAIVSAAGLLGAGVLILRARRKK